MKKIFAILLLIITLVACSKKKPDVPEGVLSMKDLQEILSDIHIAQAASTNEDFLKSMKFYTENPVLLEEVYDSVITQLSRMQAESEAGK